MFVLGLTSIKMNAGCVRRLVEDVMWLCAEEN
jgi:hypothetical protein